MDLTAAFKSEIFRPLATIIVPGFVAIAPYFIVAGYYVPSVPQFWKDHDGAFVSIFVVCVVAAGLILESIGAVIESRILDGKLGRANTKHQQEWERYLQLRLKDEIVGQRYLRTLLVHLKFELSMMPAFLALWAGLLWINCLYSTWSVRGFVVLSIFTALLVGYLIWESFQSSAALAKTRRLILEAPIQGAQADAAPSPPR